MFRLRHAPDPAPSLSGRVVDGVLAGVVGVGALDAISYLDMVTRGRPASDVPGKLVRRVAQRLNVPLATTGARDGDRGPARSGKETKEIARNRSSAAGALLGYAEGVVLGAGYAVLARRLPRPLAVAAIAAVAMAGSDVPAAAVGATDPRRWRATDWVADVVPHVGFALATVAAYEHLREGGPR